MSNCTPCTPAFPELPTFCDPNPATTLAKRLLVEDEAFCQKALTSPTVPSNLVWDNGIKWEAQTPDPSFNEFTNFTATGTSQARNLVTRFSELVNVKDFGAVGNGVADDRAAIQNAVNSCGSFGLIYIPKGTYRITTDVNTAGKKISYIINPETSFTGGGNLQNPSEYGYFYDGQSKNTQISFLKQDANAASTATFIKYSSTGNTGTKQNPALVAIGYKNNSDAFARVQGIYAEGIDNIGGAGSFVEGARFAGISLAPPITAANFAGIYGTITYAQAGFGTSNRSWSYCVGIESEVQAWHNTPSPAARNFNPNRFSSAFLATCRSGQDADVAFAVSPFTEVNWKAGFVVEKSVNPGQVTDAAFACYQTGVAYGLDLAKGSYTFAAISIPNNTAIRAYNAAGTSEQNILTLNGADVLLLGVDTNVVHIQTKNVLPDLDNAYLLGSTSRSWSQTYSRQFHPTASSSVFITAGTGSPEGVLTASVGSLFLRTNGGANTTLYIKESGAGNTGWVAK